MNRDVAGGTRRPGKRRRFANAGFRGVPGWEVVVSLAVLVLVWQVLSMHVANRVLLPPPLLVFESWWKLWLDELPQDILASLRHLGIGYSLGVVTGFVLALLAVSFRPVEIIIDPLVELLRPISGIAWIPIAILMFGISELVPIFLIFYVSTFPMFINTVAGIRAVDRRLLNAAAVLGASRRLTISHVILPAALPMVLAGVRLSLGVSWMTLIAAELVGADAGLGWRAFWYEQFFSMHKTMAIILTIGVLGYFLDLIVRRLQAALTRWNPSATAEA